MKQKKVLIKVARNAKNGQFITMKEAQKRKATTVVETIRVRVKKKS